MKRKAALLLAATVASSCMSVTGYAANFKDINDVPWEGAKTVINSVADLGLLNGYEDSTFRAKNNVTYAEATHMLYTMLVKAGMTNGVDADALITYRPFMTAWNIPAWAQNAVAYALDNEILGTEDLPKFMSGTTSNPATREDVAEMFGRALAVRYDTDRNATQARKFQDAYLISEDAIVLVDLLTKLGIISGDDTNSFAPKNNINRAEMAVMLNRAYEVVKTGVDASGTITEYDYDGSTYKLTVKTDAGEELFFYARPQSVKVYVGDSSEEIALSRLSAGDKITFRYIGGSLEYIRTQKVSSAQAKYDITGYITSLKSGTINLENENTGETEKLEIQNGCLYFVDNKSVTRSALEKALDENSDLYAYAGINTKATVEKNGSDRAETLYATEIYVTFSDNYSRIGLVDSLTDTALTFKPLDSGTTESVKLGEDCEYYNGDDEVTLKKLKEVANSGTIYVRVNVDKTGRASRITLSEESFLTEKTESVSTYTVLNVTNSKLSLELGSEKITYSFGSTNPLSNITFYVWDDSNDDWETVSVGNTEKYFDKYDSNDKEVYCRIAKNSGGKINKVYLSNKKSAWSVANSENMTERKANVASISGNTVTFANSSVKYTLLNQYNAKYDASKDTTAVIGKDVNGDTVKNPLIIHGAKTSSLTVFKKMAAAEGVTLYAEIQADGNNQLQKIEARLTAAKGKISSYDMDEKEFVLETADGTKLTLETTNRPSVPSDDYTLQNLSSAGYVGSSVELGFNSDGVVNKITIISSSHGAGSNYVGGIAESADGGLKMEDSSKTYGWLSRANTVVKNKSMDSTSLDKVKEIINDENITVYADVVLTDTDKVQLITVIVQDAKGALQDYNEDDNTVRILTDAGTKCTFNVINRPTISVKNADKDDLNKTALGKDVTLTFNSEGWVTAIKG